jgi:hypothetical protein
MSDYRSLVAKVYLRWAKCTNQLWIQYWIWCYLIYSKKVIWRRRVGIVLSEQIENTYLIEFSNVENTQNAPNFELQVRIRYVSRSAVMEIRALTDPEFRRARRQHNRCFLKLKRSLSKATGRIRLRYWRHLARGEHCAKLLHLDLWRGFEQPDSDKEFLKPLLHGNTQQASVWVIGPS